MLITHVKVLKMPRRYGKFRRRSRRSYGRAAHSAARSIGRAWRVRKRRKTSLLTRTALSNRRRIKKLSKDVETKFAQNSIASVNNDWESGLCCGGVTVDETGRWVDYQSPPVAGVYNNGSFACDMCVLQQGVEGYKRVGSWIQMKSLTLKYCITSDTKTPKTQFGLLLVLDRQPDTGGADLTDILARPGGPALNGQINAIGMSFLDQDQFGKEGRFKILKHVKHTIGGFSKSVNSTVVPAITTTLTGGGAGYASVNRPAYVPGMPVATVSGCPLTINRTISLKAPYKINYGDTSGVTPQNQTVLLMAYQYRDGPGAQSGQAGGSRCNLQWRARFRFKDA